MAEQTVKVPDIGTAADVDVVEILVAPGTKVAKEQSLIVLESEKASMEIPSPFAGVIKNITVAVGDKVSEGTPILTIEVSDDVSDEAAAEPAAEPSAEELPPPAPVPQEMVSESQGEPLELISALANHVSSPETAGVSRTMPPPAFPASMPQEPPPKVPEPRRAHATPSVRKLARELGVELLQVSGTGPHGRITRNDVLQHVKTIMSGGGRGVGFSVPDAPEIDFAQFGPISREPLTKIQKVAGRNLHRSWVTIPHVTQFDESDITELEAFRKQMQSEYPDVKLTLLSFFMKAVVSVMRRMPRFNASLDAQGENLIYKHYFHIGVAVDTENGLVVPVVRDVDKKGLVDLARELSQLSARARDRKLMPADMQGACFSISSLGGIGGTAFTPIINPPEVAILGVSRAVHRPVYKDGTFVPRLMCPLSLSYDHRVIDGALAARFTQALSAVLSDLRKLLM